MAARNRNERVRKEDNLSQDNIVPNKKFLLRTRAYALLSSILIVLLFAMTGCGVFNNGGGPPENAVTRSEDDINLASLLPPTEESQTDAERPSSTETPIPIEIGDGSFSLAKVSSDLSPEQEALILQYMDTYYDSLATLSVRDPGRPLC